MPFSRTLQLIIRPASHTLPDAAKNAQRYVIGDPIAVFDSNQFADFNNTTSEWFMNSQMGNTVFAYTHITGIPDVITLNSTVYNFTPVMFDAIVIQELIENKNTIRRRGLRLPLEKLPNTYRKYKIMGTIPPTRLNDTVYAVGDCVETIQDSEFVWQCITGGVSGSSEFTPPINYWDTIIDGTCEWKAIHNDRQITVDWSIFKQFARKKLVADKLDSAMDDEDTDRALAQTSVIDEIEDIISEMQ